MLNLCNNNNVVITIFLHKKHRGDYKNVREFEYKGEIFRATWHGIAGHEEVFILHIDKNEEEGEEASIDRMTEENDTSAPLEDILVMLCERIMPEIEDHDPSAPFAWRNGKTVYNVHNGVQALGH